MNQLAERTPLLIATEINSIKEQTKNMLLANSIEIGRRLIEAKAMVSHGEWGKWLDETVDYSQSTANNLMKLYDQYGSGQLSLFGDNSKSQAFGNLSYTQAVALLGVPADERETFIEENDIENMSTRELQKVIKEKKELERKLKESETQAEKDKVVREKVNKELNEMKIKKNDQALLIDKLKQDLEFAVNAGNNFEIDRLQLSLKDSKKEIKELNEKTKDLERQLKEKPIEVGAVVEKIPDEVKQELGTLREKVAKQKDDEAIGQFKYSFKSLVSEFEIILSALESISDKETSEQYKGAVKGLINKMSDSI
jgi:hypothetical protein